MSSKNSAKIHSWLVSIHKSTFYG